MTPTVHPLKRQLSAGTQEQKPPPQPLKNKLFAEFASPLSKQQQHVADPHFTLNRFKKDLPRSNETSPKSSMMRSKISFQTKNLRLKAPNDPTPEPDSPGAFSKSVKKSEVSYKN